MEHTTTTPAACCDGCCESELVATEVRPLPYVTLAEIERAYEIADADPELLPGEWGGGDREYLHAARRILRARAGDQHAPPTLSMIEGICHGAREIVAYMKDLRLMDAAAASRPESKRDLKAIAEAIKAKIGNKSPPGFLAPGSDSGI
jgi:hypothetical protein